MSARSLAASTLAVLLVACGKKAFPREGLVLGGRHVSYPTLRQGRSAYGMYCRSCHGEAGDGRGPAGIGLRPPPRDFRVGTIKYASVPSGQLPTDDDYVRSVRHGLRGTAMIAFDVPDDELLPIIEYLKTFSRRWRTERAGTAIRITRDPWFAHEADGIARGSVLYHGLAMCWTCHPAYVSRAEILADVLSLQHVAMVDTRADLDEPVAQIADDGTRQLPPDFLRHPLKSGSELPDLYRTVSAGVGGTAMPSFHDALPESDIWALVHYVHALVSRGAVRQGYQQ